MGIFSPCGLHGFFADGFELRCVVAVVTVASDAILFGSETFTIQFETSRSFAVAGSSTVCTGTRIGVVVIVVVVVGCHMTMTMTSISANTVTVRMRWSMFGIILGFDGSGSR